MHIIICNICIDRIKINCSNTFFINRRIDARVIGISHRNNANGSRAGSIYWYVFCRAIKN